MALIVFGITCIRMLSLICVCIKNIVITLELLYIVGIYFDECWFMGPIGHFYSCMCLVIRDVQIFLGSSVGVFISMVMIPASQLGIRA